MSTEKKNSTQKEANAVFSSEGGGQKIAGLKPAAVNPLIEPDKSAAKKSDNTKEYASKEQKPIDSSKRQRI